MQLRYVVAQIVPDLIRQEKMNVGIILQSDRWVGCKFIEKIPRDWDITEDTAQDVVHNLNNAWRKRLSEKAETLYLPMLQEQKDVKHTDRQFLEWLNQSYNRNLCFSETREADVEIADAFGLDTFLTTLYNTFVAPKPRLRKPLIRSRLHTQLKNEFKQLKLFGEFVQERYPVSGTFPWTVDFWYKYRTNGTQHEVAMQLVDFSQSTMIERIQDIFAVWMDLKYMRNDVKRVSVVGSVANVEEHRKAVGLLERASDSVLLSDVRVQLDDFLKTVQSDLEPALRSGQIFTREQFFNDLGKIKRTEH
jgi:hypothetical protein